MDAKRVTSSRFAAFNSDKFEHFEDSLALSDGYSSEEVNSISEHDDNDASNSSGFVVPSQEPMRFDESQKQNVRISTDSGLSVFVDEPHQQKVLHKLSSQWTMSFRDQQTKKDNTSVVTDQQNFSDSLEEVCTCGTVEYFWQMLNNICLPTQLKYRSSPNYMFFRDGIKPEWEDEANMDGGMWRIVLKGSERSKHLDHFWIELLMALVGEQFANAQYITGCVLQRRQKEDRFQLWTRGHENPEQDKLIQRQIGLDLKAILNLAEDCELAYTKHNDLKRFDDAKRLGRQDSRSASRGSKRTSIDARQADDAVVGGGGFTPVYSKNRSFNMRIEHATKNADGYRV
jgi:translation initiation factor 4E